MRDREAKHDRVQDQEHDRREGLDQRVADADTRGDGHQHGEREASGGQQKHRAVEVAHEQPERPKTLQCADQAAEPRQAIALELGIHAWADQAGDPVDEERSGRKCTGDFEGGLKIIGGALLLVGMACPPVVLPAAAVIAVLMLGAVAMHLKVGDPVSKFVPAALMLAMSGAICVISGM